MEEFTQMIHLSLIDKEGRELDIIRQLFREYENELGENLCFQSFDAELKDPLKKYGEPTGTLILAYWNDEVAGCIGLTEIPMSDAADTHSTSTALSASGAPDTSTALSASSQPFDFAQGQSGVCEMKRLYVRPQFRKNKIGVALVEQLIQLARNKGYKKIKLDTLQRLQPAIRLYEQFGFVHTSPYNVNPISDVIYMEKDLTGS